VLRQPECAIGDDHHDQDPRDDRGVRIIFSLKFHLGEWTRRQCIDFLVERVGHERASATGEGRRSSCGAYSLLYKAGCRLATMPSEMMRVHRMQEKLMRDFKPA
jgi:hypothetical protein